MIDFTSKGKRCRAKRMIRSHVRIINALSTGVIAYEMENLERRLILVEWDSGVSTYVFVDEIAIVDGDGARLYHDPVEELV